MSQKPKQWRVRVLRSTEEWVEVLALTGDQAEVEAVKIPRVLSVFGKSAIPGDRIYEPEPPPGVDERDPFDPHRFRGM